MTYSPGKMQPHDFEEGSETLAPAQEPLSLHQQVNCSPEARAVDYGTIEETPSHSEERYRRLFEASVDGMFLVDPHCGCITDASPALLRLLGATREQVVGQALWQIGLFPDQSSQETFLHHLQEERVRRMETIVRPLHHEQPCILEWVSSLFDIDGEEVMQGHMRDITAYKQGEALSLHLAAIVTSSDDAILSKDVDGTILSWNFAAERMYGYTAQEIIGKPVTTLFLPDHQDEFRVIMEHIRRGEHIEHFETIRVRKDGSFLPVSVTISPIKEKSGAIIGASAIARDITERKALEQERDAFVALVTHELKTPLTSLQGNVQLARRRLQRLLGQGESLSEAQKQTLEDVLLMLGRSQQSLRMQNRLINDLLDLSRLQEGKLGLSLAPCDLVEIVSATVHDYQAAHPARLITLDVPEQDCVLAEVDQDRLQQVLGNYVTNALKFSPEAEPVHVGVHREGDAIRIWVQDHGPGIAQEQQQRIWKRFYQAPQVDIQHGWKTGLGLGLYICQHLIGQHGGQVGVESAPGQGATFWFTLPCLASHETT